MTVTLIESGDTATVGEGGTFTLPAQAAGAVATIESDRGDATYYGAATRVTLDGSGGGQLQLPIMTRAAVSDIYLASALAQLGGDGILAVKVFDAANPAVNATLSDVGAVQARYDTGDATTFFPGTTGPEGTGLYLNVGPADSVTVTATRTGSLPGSVTTFVVGDAIVFTSVALMSS